MNRDLRVQNPLQRNEPHEPLPKLIAPRTYPSTLLSYAKKKHIHECVSCASAYIGAPA
jgi:hypothetical protein